MKSNLRCIFIFIYTLFLLPNLVFSQSIDTIGNLWHPVNNPAYPILNNLYFLSTTEGWIVGDLGKVLHTVDGGDHWIDVPAGINTTLRAVFFSDETTGYIGGDGNILRTRDGGFSWTKTTTDFDIYDIYFDPVLKNKGYAVGSKGIILSTNDYGNTWSSTTSGNQTMNRIAFNLPNKGWVTGSVFTTGSGSWANYNDSTTLPIIEGSISFTDNSGLTWAYVSSGYTLTDLQFINSNIGYLPENQMVSYHLDSVSDSLGYPGPYGHYNFTYDINHYLFKTSDGWNTFSSSPIFSESSITSIRPVNISFPSANIGYAIGEDLDKIYKTTDSGYTWNSLTTGFDSLLIKRILFKTPNYGWLIGYIISNNLEIGIILVTHNGGQSWQKQSSEQGFSPVNPLESIAFSPDGYGWMAGSGNLSAQYKSYDNGKSWYLISTVYNNGYDLLALNQNTVFLAGDYLHISKDGGVNWNNSSFDYYTNRIKRITLSNSSTIISSGFSIYYYYFLHYYYTIYYPVIYQTMDLGSTWSQRYSGTTSSLDISGLYFVNETTGWATLHYDFSYNFNLSTTIQYLLHTEDGGNSWVEQNLPEYSQYMAYRDVFFTTTSTGWVCDDYGRVLNTVDAGSTWKVWQASNTFVSGRISTLNTARLGTRCGATGRRRP